MTHIVPIDPLKPHVTIAIAAPERGFSNDVRVIGGGYGGDTDEEIRAYFRQLCGVGPDVTEAAGWRLVDLPYDQGTWTPPEAETTAPHRREDPTFLVEAQAIYDEVLEQDRRPVG